MGEEILLRSTSLTVVNPIPFVFDVCCKDAVESWQQLEFDCRHKALARASDRIIAEEASNQIRVK